MAEEKNTRKEATTSSSAKKRTQAKKTTTTAKAKTTAAKTKKAKEAIEEKKVVKEEKIEKKNSVGIDLVLALVGLIILTIIVSFAFNVSENINRAKTLDGYNYKHNTLYRRY